MVEAGVNPRARALFDPAGVGRKTLWAIRVIVVLVFGAWAYSTLTWPDMPSWAVAIPTVFSILVYVIAVRAAAAVAAGNGRIDGENVHFVGEGRYITRARLWGARVGAVILIVGGGGLVSVARPYESAGAVFGILVLYWATLQALSAPK